MDENIKTSDIRSYTEMEKRLEEIAREFSEESQEFIHYPKRRMSHKKQTRLNRAELVEYFRDMKGG